MFLHELTPDERVAFLALARSLVTADQHLDLGEIAVLHHLAAELGVSVQTGGAADAPPPEEAFATLRAREIAILELLRLAYADGRFGGEEVVLVTDLAARFRIPGNRLRAFDSWVRDYITLVRRCEQAILTPPTGAS